MRIKTPSPPPPAPSREAALQSLATDATFPIAFATWMLERQTYHERRYAISCVQNGIGFNSVDAKPLTALAKISRERALTADESQKLQQALRKYIGQLFHA